MKLDDCCSFRCSLSHHISMGKPHHLISVNGAEYPISNKSYLRILNEVSVVREDCYDAARLIHVVDGVRQTERFVSLTSMHYISNWRVNIERIRLDSEDIKRRFIEESAPLAFSCVNQSEFAFD